MKVFPWQQWIIDDALTIPPAVVASLPRFKMPDTYTVLSPDNLIVARKSPGMHLEGDIRRWPGSSVHPDVYDDCPWCRRARMNLFAQRPSFFSDRDAIDYVRDSRIYWCNHCQATGWFIEDVEKTVARLGATTLEAMVAALSPLELATHIELALLSPPRSRFSKDLLMSEAGARAARLIPS